MDLSAKRVSNLLQEIMLWKITQLVTNPMVEYVNQKYQLKVMLLHLNAGS